MPTGSTKTTTYCVTEARMTIAEINNMLKLPVEQRILLVEDVWDSIRPQSERIPVLETHKQELDRRFEKYQHDPAALLNDKQLRDALAPFNHQ
jgi:putative addiction module component (TIGR02574 family)